MNGRVIGPLSVALRLERFKGEVGAGLVALEELVMREEVEAEVAGALEAVDLTVAVVDTDTKRLVVVVVAPLVVVEDVRAAIAEDVLMEVETVEAIDIAAEVADEEEDEEGAALD